MPTPVMSPPHCDAPKHKKEGALWPTHSRGTHESQSMPPGPKHNIQSQRVESLASENLRHATSWTAETNQKPLLKVALERAGQEVLARQAAWARGQVRQLFGDQVHVGDVHVACHVGGQQRLGLVGARDGQQAMQQRVVDALIGCQENHPERVRDRGLPDGERRGGGLGAAAHAIDAPREVLQRDGLAVRRQLMRKAVKVLPHALDACCLPGSRGPRHCAPRLLHLHHRHGGRGVPAALAALKVPTQLAVQLLVAHDQHGVGLERLDGVQKQVVAQPVDPAHGVDDEAAGCRLRIPLRALVQRVRQALHDAAVVFRVVGGADMAVVVRQRRLRGVALLDIDGDVDRACGDVPWRHELALTDVQVHKCRLPAAAHRVVNEDAAQRALPRVCGAHHDGARPLAAGRLGLRALLVQDEVRVVVHHHRCLAGLIDALRLAHHIQLASLPCIHRQLLPSDVHGLAQCHLRPKHLRDAICELDRYRCLWINLDSQLLPRGQPVLVSHVAVV
mmetsp:Transcript_13708/g.35213  ORF Transcript_13708/g.35213 Transcript_13708/m.35213 type:complete len:505 (+) Transcript_13708:810-2324(+)